MECRHCGVQIYRTIITRHLISCPDFKPMKVQPIRIQVSAPLHTKGWDL